MRKILLIIKLLTADFIFTYLILGNAPIIFYMSKYISLMRDFNLKYSPNSPDLSSGGIGKLELLYLVFLFMLFVVILIVDAIFTGLAVYKSNEKQAHRNLISTIIILCVNGHFMYILSVPLSVPDRDESSLKIISICIVVVLSALVVFAYKYIHKKLLDTDGSEKTLI